MVLKKGGEQDLKKGKIHKFFVFKKGEKKKRLVIKWSPGTHENSLNGRER